MSGADSFFVPEFVWSQEEHRNMGAWFFVHPRFENLCSTKVSVVMTVVHSCFQELSITLCDMGKLQL